jgi:hypothetical protein
MIAAQLACMSGQLTFARSCLSAAECLSKQLGRRRKLCTSRFTRETRCRDARYHTKNLYMASHSSSYLIPGNLCAKVQITRTHSSKGTKDCHAMCTISTSSSPGCTALIPGWLIPRQQRLCICGVLTTPLASTDADPLTTSNI